MVALHPQARALPQRLLRFPRRIAGQLHHDAESATGPGGEGKGSVVRLGDALDDGQAEADTRLVTAYTSRAPLEWFGARRDQLRAELVAGVFDGEHDGLRADGGAELHGAVFGEVVDDGIVQEVRGHLQQESGCADGG